MKPLPNPNPWQKRPPNRAEVKAARALAKRVSLKLVKLLEAK